MADRAFKPMRTTTFADLLYDPWALGDAELAPRLAARGFPEARRSYTAVFHNLAEGGSRITEIAERAGLAKPSVVYLVDELERLGVVERVPDPADGRAKLVRPTPRGREALAAAREVAAEIEAEWTRLLGARKMAQLRGLLEELHEALWPPERQP
ncbi:MAG TPA: MarR family transcriptional regulator [Baekduia sp.]|nr:MarR family transcriptional regulator [Baekduia sp.]